MKFFFSSLLIISSLLGVFANTPAQVIADLKDLTSQLTSMDKDVKALTSKDIPGAWDIHAQAGHILSSIKVATENLKAGVSNPVPNTEAQNQKIRAAGDSITAIIVTTLKDLIAKEKTIIAIPVVGAGAKQIVLQDLRNLKASTRDYQDVMIAAAKGDMKQKALAMAKAINNAFDRAIAVYAN